MELNFFKQEDVGADVGGTNGNITIVEFISYIYHARLQRAFDWTKATGPGTYDWTIRFLLMLPWSDGRVIIDHAVYLGGRSEI